MTNRDALIEVTSQCSWCGRWLTRWVEPEWETIVTRYGICEACYATQEQARNMEDP